MEGTWRKYLWFLLASTQTYAHMYVLICNHIHKNIRMHTRFSVTERCFCYVPCFALHFPQHANCFNTPWKSYQKAQGNNALTRISTLEVTWLKKKSNPKSKTHVFTNDWRGLPLNGWHAHIWMTILPHSLIWVYLTFKDFPLIWIKTDVVDCQRPRLITQNRWLLLRGWLILFLDSITESLDLDVCEEQYGRDGRDTDGPSSGQLLCATLQPLWSSSPSHESGSLFYLLGARGRVAEETWLSRSF